APGVPTPAPAARERPRAEPLYGGRTVAWWGQRLEELRSASDEARRGLYQATVERAEANGLTVTVTASGVQVAAGPAPGGLPEARP
ncbi:MAG: hypothetical protein NDI82_00345, partial [Anaeromyxobacteraceae bacterium]|nr:hypothetical protein [Anaeromyxobacteraceae bacterium]